MINCSSFPAQGSEEGCVVFPQTALIKTFPSGGSVCSRTAFYVQPAKLIQQTHPLLTAAIILALSGAGKWKEQSWSPTHASSPPGMSPHCKATGREHVSISLCPSCSASSVSGFLPAWTYLSSTMCPGPFHLLQVLSPILQYYFCPSPFSLLWAFPVESPIVFTKVPQLNFLLLHEQFSPHLWQYPNQYLEITVRTKQELAEAMAFGNLNLSLQTSRLLTARSDWSVET